MRCRGPGGTGPQAGGVAQRRTLTRTHTAGSHAGMRSRRPEGGYVRTLARTQRHARAEEWHGTAGVWNTAAARARAHALPHCRTHARALPSQARPQTQPNAHIYTHRTQHTNALAHGRGPKTTQVHMSTQSAGTRDCTRPHERRNTDTHTHTREQTHAPQNHTLTQTDTLAHTRTQAPAHTHTTLT